MSLINIESYGTWLQTKIRILAFFCIRMHNLSGKRSVAISFTLSTFRTFIWTTMDDVYAGLQPTNKSSPRLGFAYNMPSLNWSIVNRASIESLHFYKTKLFRYSRTTVQQNSRIWIVLPFDDDVRFFPGKMKVSWKFVTLVLQTNDQNDRRTA